MRTRNWPIRTKIIALIATPVAALLALWVFAGTLAAGPALHLLSARTVLDTVYTPGQALMGELQRERRLAVEFLSTPDSSPSALAAQRAATDRAAADFRRRAGSGDAQDAATDALRVRIRRVLAGLGGLADSRRRIDRRQVDPVGAQGLFDTVIGAGFQMFTAAAALDDRLAGVARALTTVGRGQEYLSRADKAGPTRMDK